MTSADVQALWGAGVDVLTNPAFLPAAAAALLGLVLVMVAGRLIRRARQSPIKGKVKVPGRKLENLLTLAAAGVATGVAAVGMWRFFEDVLDIKSVWLRATLFAFLEISLMVSAIRARRHLLDDLERAAVARLKAEEALSHTYTDADREAAEARLAAINAERASTGVDGIAVWVLALLSGCFAAMDADSPSMAIFRLSAPLVAAWLWERGLAAERRRHRSTTRRINWRVTPERVFVALGLAEPTGRGVDEVDTARRLARLARSAYRLHTLRSDGLFGWQRALAERRLRRETEAATEHIGLADAQDVRDRLRVYLATLYQVEAGTAPAAVAGLTPWGELPDLDGDVVELEAVSVQTAPGKALMAPQSAPQGPAGVSATTGATAALAADVTIRRPALDRWSQFDVPVPVSVSDAPAGESERVPAQRVENPPPPPVWSRPSWTAPRSTSGSAGTAHDVAPPVALGVSAPIAVAIPAAEGSKRANLIELLNLHVGLDDTRSHAQLARDYAPMVGDGAGMNEDNARKIVAEWMGARLETQRATERHRGLRTVT